MKAMVLLLLAALSAAVAAEEPIQPIERPKNVNVAKVELGKQLFFDARLSKSGWISCNSCHNLSRGGTDNLVSSVGHGWAKGPINAPTVLNSSYNIVQFWDGRAADLKAQAGGPIANPGEMASTHELAVKVLQTIPGYVTSFEKVYGKGPVTIDHATDAIAEFERTLVTPDSRFDLWLKGDKHALTAQELAGYELFKVTGCVGCHNGPAVGGATLQRMGSFNPYVTANPSLGVAGLSGQSADRYRFKVPILRNIELTAPYFHDGAAKTLEEAVDTMVWVQLNRHFTPAGRDKIVAFLKTLTGKQPDFPIPQLPPSGPDTPAPQPFDP